MSAFKLYMRLLEFEDLPAVVGIAGVAGAVVLISLSLATGATHGQRCDKHYKAKTEEHRACVQRLKKGMSLIPETPLFNPVNK